MGCVGCDGFAKKNTEETFNIILTTADEVLVKEIYDKMYVIVNKQLNNFTADDVNFFFDKYNQLTGQNLLNDTQAKLKVVINNCKTLYNKYRNNQIEYVKVEEPVKSVVIPTTKNNKKK
jgi:hypothetical protein